MKLTTTLNRIRAYCPSPALMRTMLEHLGPDYDPDADINLLTILESNGVQDTLWCLRATEQDSHRTAVKLGLAFAERALSIWGRAYQNDSRIRDTLRMVRAWLGDTASTEDVQAVTCVAAYAADAAVRAAYATAADAEIEAQAEIIRGILT